MNRFVLLFVLFISLPVQAQSSEQLHYRLTYSGLITGFIWKELADVTLNLTPEETNFRGEAATRLSMDVTTENYGLAESIHALRYHWESILDPTLQRTLLVRVIDEGDSDNHNVSWYDWENKNIALFEKRKQKDVSIPIFDETPRLEWEKNKLPPPPAFIDSHPEITPGLSYLMMSKFNKGKLEHDAIDPVAMLMRLRHHDYRTQSILPMHIVLKNDLSPYHARLVGEDSLEFQDKPLPSLKVEVKRSNNDGEEGAMWVWLSDDERRLPLRIDVEAPLGTLHIELERVQ